jgi:hypothetical protein
MDAGRGSNRHDQEERDFQGPLYAKSRVFALSFLASFHCTILQQY